MLNDNDNNLRKNSFMGLTPYSDIDHQSFFGREEELESLITLFRKQQVTIIYGKSGAGKTSILRAGVYPRLMIEGYKVVYNRINFFTTETTPTNQTKNNIISQVNNEVEQNDSVVHEESLLKVIDEVQSNNVKLVLIFDQFEELFNSTNRIEAKNFIIELSEIVQAQNRKTNFDNFKVLISIREDYLARLEQLDKIFPSILQPKFHLGDLDSNSAFTVIMNLGKGVIEYEEAKLIVDKLRKPNFDNFLINDADLIEVPMLQLLLMELNEIRIKQAHKTIDVSLIAATNFDALYLSFVQECLKFIPLKEQRALISQLISEDGKRLMIDFNQFRNSKYISLETLYRLIDRRILTKHLTAYSEYVEISHDILIEPLLNLRNQIVKDEIVREKEFEIIKSEQLQKAVELKKAEELVRQKKLLSKKNVYDVAISYAREDGEVAEKIAAELKVNGYNVFYDKFEKANLWGRTYTLT